MLWVYQRVIFGKPSNYDPAVALASAHGGHDDHAAANDTHADEGHGHDAHGHGHHPDPDILNNGAKFPDLNFGEWFTLYPMGILAILVGIFPGWVLDFFNQPAQNLTTALSSHGQPVVSLLDYLGHIIH
jgi:NADH:ubiquinone oxidoreductase subunit 4 (subunit M)